MTDQVAIPGQDLAAVQTLGPDTPSGDHAAMSEFWSLIDAILGGAKTMRVEKYLPKFEDEGPGDYKRRLNSAPFTNIYADASSNLASKPFSRELTLKEGSSSEFEKMAEDVDGQGNNLHNFAHSLFQRGIDKAIDWILVDYTKIDREPGARSLTKAEEAQIGVRSYWVHVPAEKMLAVYSDRVNGEEIFVHARIAEPMVERVQFGEVTKTRVRVLDRAQADDGSYAPATYEVFEQQKGKDGKLAWTSIEGPSPITIGIIPIVPFYTGKRVGTSWLIRPPLRDLAYLQISEFQQESGLQQTLEYCAFPMLGAFGVKLGEPNAPAGAPIKVAVGPKAILNAPPDDDGNHGEWKFVEPAATSITALETHLQSTQKNMRDLGMQPMTQAALTVITTANVSMKAHSAVQAWVLRLKDSLEQAWKYTAMWLGDVSKAPEIDVFQDFGVDLQAGVELESLLKMQAQGVLSKQTTQEEFRRRNVLSDNFDVAEEKKRLAEDEEGLEPEVAEDPITGEIVEPTTRPLVISKPAGLPPQTVN